jgi:site-specific DNA-methyltransferase (adenine-specific)
MVGTQAVCLWTDPPYGVAYTGKTADALTITGDGADGLGELLAGAFACLSGVLDDAGWRFHQALVWVKDVFVLGHSDYHYRHEDILYGYLPGEGRSGRGDHAGTRWCGDHSQDTVLEIPRRRRSTEHPTTKPVELITRCLGNSAPIGGIVLDPFAGSGSTLIACCQTGRVARLCEIDPGYVDVIVRRWSQFTGQMPVLEATGEEVSFVSNT